MGYETRTMPVARVNRGLTVEILAEASRAGGKDAMLLLLLLVWKRHTTGETWVTIPNAEWKARVGRGPRKRRAAARLETAGLIRVRREGKLSLRFKLSRRVDPKSTRKTDKNPSATDVLREFDSDDLINNLFTDEVGHA